MPPYVFQPSSYPLHYPTEIAAIIAGFVGEGSLVGFGIYSPDGRNSDLLDLALVSSMWASAAIPLLYSELQIQWRSSTGLLLLKTLKKRPELLTRIRRVEVSYPTHHMLTCEIRENRTAFDDDELKQRWDALGEAERTVAGAGEDGYDGWCTELDFEAARATVDEGPDGLWAGDDIDDAAVKVGTRAFWRLVAKLPRLQHLAVESVSFLVRKADKSPLDKVLKGLTSFAIHSSDEFDATPPLAALAAAENIRSLQISTHDLTPFPISPGATPFPHLRHLNVIAWDGDDGDFSWTTPGSQLSEACPTLDLALAARATLQSLTIEEPDCTISGDDPRISNRLIGEAVRLLPHLRTLILPPSVTDPPGQPRHIIDRSPSGNYPDVFLAALAASSLEHFAIGDVPDAKLLAALPISLTSLTFDPRNGPRPAWLFEALLDQFVKVVLEVKGRLPALALVTLNLHESRGNNSGPVLHRHWDVFEEVRPSYRVIKEENPWREERQLRREAVAADVGVCLHSRPSGKVNYGR